jgi:hypothetical protein
VLLHQLAFVNRTIVLNNKGKLLGFSVGLSSFRGEPIHHLQIAFCVEAADTQGIVKAFVRLPYAKDADPLPAT